MLKKIICTLMCTAVLFTTACGGSSGAAPADSQPAAGESKEMTLRFFSAWGENDSMNLDMNKFMEKVAEKSGGTLKVEWGGGPESIPPFQLAEAIKNGVVDIAWSCHTYNVSHVPVMEAMKMVPSDVIRENGGFEFVNDLYKEKLSAEYLGNPTHGLTYNLYTKREIKSIDDFKGMTIRATPAYQAFVEGLGAGAMNMSPGEAYQALERDVIQGYGWPSVGVSDYGWQEVSEYIVEPAFYNVDVAVFVSDKIWAQLSESQRTALKEAGKEVEEEAHEFYTNKIKEDKEALVAGGMIMNELPAAEAEKYSKLAYSEGWKKVLTADAENGKKLQEFAGYTE